MRSDVDRNVFMRRMTAFHLAECPCLGHKRPKFAQIKGKPLSIEIKSSFAGPGFWGLINPQWPLCTKGRRQSPINVEPDKLLYDPYLRPLHLDKHKVSVCVRLLPKHRHKSSSDIEFYYGLLKGKVIPLQAWCGPEGG